MSYPRINKTGFNSRFYYVIYNFIVENKIQN